MLAPPVLSSLSRRQGRRKETSPLGDGRPICLVLPARPGLQGQCCRLPRVAGSASSRQRPKASQLATLLRHEQGRLLTVQTLVVHGNDCRTRGSAALVLLTVMSTTKPG